MTPAADPNSKPVSTQIPGFNSDFETIVCLFGSAEGKGGEDNPPIRCDPSPHHLWAITRLGHG